MFDSAKAGIHTQAASLAGLGGSILELMVVVAAIMIATEIGAQYGLQKHIKGAAVALFVSAMILKTYQALVTSSLAMF